MGIKLKNTSTLPETTLLRISLQSTIHLNR